MKITIIVFISCLVAVVACSESNTTHKDEMLVDSGPASATHPHIEEKTENNFSTVDKLVAGRRNIFKADLNADNIEDTLSIVNSALINTSMLATMTVLHPWSYYGEGTQPAELAKGSKISLYVELSSGASAAHNYLIYDVNTPSILDADAASELFISKISLLDQVEFKDLVSRARGDIIVIPTEAGIDTYIYWNGESFITYELAEQP